MNQLRLFEGGKHLEQCPEDPPIDSFEMTYYTQWQILYAGSLACDSPLPSTDSHDSSSLDNGSGDIHSSIVPLETKNPIDEDRVVGISTYSTEVDIPIIAEVIQFPNKELSKTDSNDMKSGEW